MRTLCKKQLPICLELDGKITTLPITIGARGLASLLAPYIDRTEETILRDISRSPDSLPESELYGGARKIWDTKKVLDWLPAGVRAAIIREFANKNGGIPKTNQPPPMKSIAENLVLANLAIAHDFSARQDRQISKSRFKKS